jgi:hypothetical protein
MDPTSKAAEWTASPDNLEEAMDPTNKATMEPTASECEESKGEESEDSESDESGGLVSTRGRGVRGSKTRGRGGDVGVANVLRTTRSTQSTMAKRSTQSAAAAANTGVGTSMCRTKRKAEDDQEKPARYVLSYFIFIDVSNWSTIYTGERGL